MTLMEPELTLGAADKAGQELLRKAPPVFVDTTHMGRHVTGIERITAELFSPSALAPLRVEHLARPFGGIAGMVAGQQVSLPLRLMRRRDAVLITPGFPPAPALSLFMAGRVVPYVHDLFLITRPQDLSLKAKLYMVPAFRLMLRHMRRYLVNSHATARELRAHCRADAQIRLYRPAVRNVFGVERQLQPRADLGRNGELRLLAIGTLEPRKNYEAAARIVQALRARGFPGARLDIVGRPGWGGVAERLKDMPGVHLHGYLSAGALRALIARSDAYLCTSADEGLGLPLLEVQHAALPVIAPRAQVFNEVLGASALFITPEDPRQAAGAIAAALADAGAVRAWRARAIENVLRWNTAAEQDRRAVIRWLARGLHS